MSDKCNKIFFASNVTVSSSSNIQIPLGAYQQLSHCAAVVAIGRLNPPGCLPSPRASNTITLQPVRPPLHVLFVDLPRQEEGDDVDDNEETISNVWIFLKHKS